MEGMKRSLRVDQLAARWGVHRATIYRMMACDELPFFVAGKTRRVLVQHVEAIESTNCRKVSQSVAPTT